MVKKYLGREIKEEHSFKTKGTFESYYAACRWCGQNGFRYGSGCVGGPTALQKGTYDLPQKWKNFTKENKASVDGVMVSNDWREGEVIIYIFK